MPKLTIATFNCENLFLRYKFESKTSADAAVTNGFIIDPKKFEVVKDKEREITAAAILELKPDIIALQEVENMDALKNFNANFLGGKYKYKMLIDGNDPRLIDVAVLSKYPFDYAQTHQFRRTSKSYIFSRDCLEVALTINGKPLHLFVNHFKSMMGGRAETAARRESQAREVVKILTERFGEKAGDRNWIMLGDLNDYQPGKTIQTLLDTGWMENIVERLPEADRWTHAYGKETNQLDYIFLSKALAKANPNAKPSIVRKGLALNVKHYTGPRFEGVGKERPHASDHCPVGVGLEW